MFPNIFQKQILKKITTIEKQFLDFLLNSFSTSNNLYQTLTTHAYYELRLLSLQKELEVYTKFKLLELYEIGNKSLLKWNKKNNFLLPINEKLDVTNLRDGFSITFNHHKNKILVYLDQRINYSGIQLQIEKPILLQINKLFSDCVNVYLNNPDVDTKHILKNSLFTILQKNKNHKNLTNDLLEIYDKLLKIINYQDPICDIIELERITDHEPSEIKNFEYVSNEQYENDEEVLALQDIFSLKFYLFLRAHNYNLWNEIMNLKIDNKKIILEWYDEKIKEFNDFDNCDRGNKILMDVIA